MSTRMRHGPLRMQCWAFANMNYEPGEQFWHAVGLNTINHIHEYSAQNIANGKHRPLSTANPVPHASSPVQHPLNATVCSEVCMLRHQQVPKHCWCSAFQSGWCKQAELSLVRCSAVELCQNGASSRGAVHCCR